MSRFLVCPPDHFGIQYEINPWMRLSNTVDKDASRAQWQTLARVLEQDAGAKLERMTPVAGLPDLVFTANAGVVHDGTAVVSRFRHPERRGEEEHFARWFREHGYRVIHLDAECYFEGAGDLLGFPDTWFGGYRQRSDIKAHRVLSDVYGREILPLELVTSRFYHLDTCFCPLSNGELLYYPPAFDAYAQATIADRVDKRQTSRRASCRSRALCVQRRVRRAARGAAVWMSGNHGHAQRPRLHIPPRRPGSIPQIRRLCQMPHAGFGLAARTETRENFLKLLYTCIIGPIPSTASKQRIRKWKDLLPLNTGWMMSGTSENSKKFPAYSAKGQPWTS